MDALTLQPTRYSIATTYVVIWARLTVTYDKMAAFSALCDLGAKSILCMPIAGAGREHVNICRVSPNQDTNQPSGLLLQI